MSNESQGIDYGVGNAAGGSSADEELMEDEHGMLESEVMPLEDDGAEDSQFQKAAPQKPAQQLYPVDLAAERAAKRRPWETLQSQGFSRYVDQLKLNVQRLPVAVMLYETSGLRELPDAIADAGAEEFKQIGSNLFGGMLADSMLMVELAKQSILDSNDTETRLKRMPKFFEAQRNSTALLSAIKVLKGPSNVKITAKQVNLAQGPQQVVNGPSKLGQDRQPEQLNLF